MKKLSSFLATLSLVFLLGTICYAEPYETDQDSSSLATSAQTAIAGIWQVAGQMFFISVNINGDTVVGVTYVPGAGESFLMGYVAGNKGYVNYASDLSQFDATITLTSNTTGTMTVNKCVPFSGESCLLPAGATVNIVKIF